MSVESPFFDALIGKPISHMWRGHGSAIFVEFGELTTRTKEDKNTAKPFGELSLMIEWSWRIEKPKSILGAYSYPKEPLITTAKRPPITVSKRPPITIAKKPVPILNQAVAFL